MAQLPERRAQVPWRHVERELARARAARRLLPWIALTTLGAAALAGVAARSWRPSLILLAPGAAFALVTFSMARPRCPECGGGLWLRGEAPGSPSQPRQTRVERERRCPRCGEGLA